MSAWRGFSRSSATLWRGRGQLPVTVPKYPLQALGRSLSAPERELWFARAPSRGLAQRLFRLAIELIRVG